MAVSTLVADRFELLSEAGKGAMGSVHRARDRKTGNPVAVKILILDRELDVGRFGREATLLSQLRHPNIVGYVSHGTTADGQHYLAQEWVDGLTLRTQLKTIGVTAADAVMMASGIADALAAAHGLGVLHRDVKPENLILAGGDPARIKLVDFGIARTTDEAARLTRTGVMIGTPAYMSPEQARGESQLGPGVDVWALGCVLYEMLSGRTPYAGQTPMAIRAKVLFDHHAPLAPLCTEAPPALIELVESMLAKEAASRPATGAAIATGLRALPPIAAGPRRRTGASEPPTSVMPVRPMREDDKKSVNCFVFFNSCEVAVSPADTVTDHSVALGRAAAKHGLAVHMLEDGSAVLAAKARGREAAVDATRAALELQQMMPSAAVSVVGSDGNEIDAALERGGLALERSAMQALFGDIVGDGSSGVHVDQVIAELVAGDVTVEQAESGPIVRASR
jgi:eukaryotic-like serine/threonine-protein kinase